MKEQLRFKVFRSHAAQAASIQEALRLPLDLAVELRGALVRAGNEQWEFTFKWLQAQSSVSIEMFNRMTNPAGYVPLHLVLAMFAVAVCERYLFCLVRRLTILL